MTGGPITDDCGSITMGGLLEGDGVRGSPISERGGESICSGAFLMFKVMFLLWWCRLMLGIPSICEEEDEDIK